MTTVVREWTWEDEVRLCALVAQRRERKSRAREERRKLRLLGLRSNGSRFALRDRNEEIVQAWTTEAVTLEQLAERFGVTRERIRQILGAGLGRTHVGERSYRRQWLDALRENAERDRQ